MPRVSASLGSSWPLSSSADSAGDRVSELMAEMMVDLKRQSGIERCQRGYFNEAPPAERTEVEVLPARTADEETKAKRKAAQIAAEDL